MVRIVLRNGEDYSYWPNANPNVIYHDMMNFTGGDYEIACEAEEWVREAAFGSRYIFREGFIEIVFDEILDNGYEYVASRRGYDIYRKIINGKGYWKAKKEGKIKDITYQQALGYEPIDNAESLGMELGKMLLPR